MASASAFGFSKSDFKRDCEGLIREFFTHGVLDDVEDSLRELLTRPYRAAPTRLGAIDESPAVETTSWPSLSAVAREITGARWSGPRFFGLQGKANGRRS